MSPTHAEAMLETLAARLAELQQAHTALHNENTRLAEEIKALRAERPVETAPIPPHDPSQTRNRRPSRRGMLQAALGVAAATIGAGGLMETSTSTALAADNPGTFTSSVAGIPAVTATGTNGATGVSATSNGTGVSATGDIYGLSASSGSTAIYANGGGEALNAYSLTGTAVHAIAGNATATTGVNAAVLADGGNVQAVYATSANTGGLATIAAYNTGVGVGIFGLGAPTYPGVWGTSTSSAAGVYGDNTGSGVGVYGKGAPGYGGVWGDSSSSAAGVYATNSGSGNGVNASATSGVAVSATSGSSSTGGGTDAVFAQSYGGNALHGVVTAASQSAVVADGGSGTGVKATSTGAKPAVSATGTGSGAAVVGSSTRGYGGSFTGGSAAIHLTPTATAGPPTAGAHLRGDLIVDSAGILYICTASGTPGTWTKVGAQ